MEEATRLVGERRQVDGRWVTEGRAPGDVWFEVDVAPGEHSKWISFFAERAIRWWHGDERLDPGEVRERDPGNAR